MFFLHQWCQLLPYFWFKRVFRLTLLNDCHLSYQRIWHIGLDGLLCSVLLINLQTQQLSPSLSNSFSICWGCVCVYFLNILKYLASPSFAWWNWACLSTKYFRKQNGKGTDKGTPREEFKYRCIISIILWQHRIITLFFLVQGPGTEELKNRC